MAFINCHFKSSVLGMDCSLHVLLPEDRDGPHPVLWLYHGLSDDHTAWTRRTAIESYVRERPLAVVMPCVHRSFYWDMVRGLPYGTFVREELPELARRMFPLSAAPKDNFLAGLSMGGYGAFLAALTHPERYAAAASLSGALDVRMRLEKSRQENPERLEEYENIFGDLERVENHPANLEFLVRRHVQAKRKLPQLYACCGTEDFLYEDNLNFAKLCREIGQPLEFETGPGAHEWSFWDKWIQRVLKWLPIPDSEGSGAS